MVWSQYKIGAVVIIALLFVIMSTWSPYRLFGNEFGTAVVTFSTVGLTYFASSLVSRLSLSHKLKKNDMTHHQLMQKMTPKKILLMIVKGIMLAAVAGITAYLSTDTVEHSAFNYAVLMVAFPIPPTVAAALSWFDA